MQREQLGGALLMVGAVAGVITMAIHPTGADVARDLAGQGMLSELAHGIAILATPLLFYGLFVLTARLAPMSVMAEVALVTFGAAAISVTLAALLNGFMATTLLGEMAMPNASHPTDAMIVHYNAALGSLFAKLYVFGAAIAIGLWSVSILQSGLMGAGPGYFGLLVSALTLVMVGSGHLKVSIHGLAGVVLADALWFVMVGLGLLKLGRGVAGTASGSSL